MTARTLIGRKPIRRALISVYDKSGLIALAQGLHEAGVELVSTGSTAKTIADKGIPVTPVEFVTGFPEILDGRVKTLHPHVHAGLLADTRNPEHLAALQKLKIEPFDLVVVNLYPFSETVDSGADVDECVEQIDIGGPSMVRAAAKNHASVAVVVEPLGYDGVLAAVRGGGFTLEERKKLASLAFRHTAEYDIAVACWTESTLAPESGDTPAFLPPWLGRNWRRTSLLRYGENPHQQAALYSDDAGWPGLAQAEQLHGKEMSYNNFTDADAAWRAAFDHRQICVAIIKHANPCGIAVSSVSVADAHRKAHECDPLSAFGGVIAANTEITVEMAEQVAEIFTEVIIAPAYEQGAVEVLARKKNVRVLVAGEPEVGGVEIRQISGGLLMQQRDGIDALVVDVFAIQLDLAQHAGRGDGVVHPVQAAQEGGLAAARGADEGRHGAGQDVDIDILQRVVFAVIDLHAAGGDLGSVGGHGSLRNSHVVHRGPLTNGVQNGGAARWRPHSW